MTRPRSRRVAVALAIAAAFVAVAVPVSAAPQAPHEAVPTDPAWTHATSWGNNNAGQLGTGDTARATAPTPVYGSHLGFRSVDAGSEHSLAVAADGTVYGWGQNADGELGDMPVSQTSFPRQVDGLTDVIQVSAGWLHSMALRADGTVWTWGRNHWGQLGDGSTVHRRVPAQVPGLTDVARIAAGGGHSVALREDGTVWTWGNSEAGQIGDGLLINRLAPVPVPNLAGVVDIEAGFGHTLALRSNGFPELNTVWAWGRNDKGQIGIGSTVDQIIAARVEGLSGVTAIGTGRSHSLVARHDGSVWTWGANHSGALGDGTTTNRVRAVQVAGLNGVTAVAGGDAHSVALRFDGTVRTWGANHVGQLGDGTLDDRHTPVPLSGLSGVSRITAGHYHTMVVRPFAPPPRFTIAVAPDSGRVAAGDSLSVTVSTTAVNGSTQTVGLGISGLPAGITAAFDPPQVTAGGTATLTLASTELAALGSAVLTITGEAIEMTRYPTMVTAELELVVGEARDPGCAAANPTDVVIPDAGDPASSPVVIAGCAEPDPTSTAVEVHIEHARRGDLVIDLVGPGGVEYRLKDENAADHGRDVHATFQVHLDGKWDGQVADSQWHLRVQDVASGATGRIESWSLHL